MAEKSASHDLLFKALMARKDVARDFINVFLPEIAQRIDIDSLQRMDKSFVDNALKQSLSDMIFTAKVRDSEAFIVFLYEHKSSKDKFLYLQLYQYIGNIFTFYRRQNQKLPVVIPIVFYHGKERFRYPNYEEIFSITDKPFAGFIPRFKVEFFDLHTYGEQYVQKAEEHFALVVLIGLMSNVFNKPEQMIEFLLFLKNRHKDRFKSNKDILELTLSYLGKFRKFANEPYKTQIMDSLLKDIDYEPGSMIDQWIKEGMEKGLQQGLQQGIEKERELNIVRMLRKGFSVKDIVEILEVEESFVLKVKQKNNL